MFEDKFVHKLIMSRSEEAATSFRDIAERFLTRPAKMLVLEPILLCMAFYISVVFGKF